MEDWRGKLAGLEGPRREAMEFLQCHLPEDDLQRYPFELFLTFADHALLLRDGVPRCGGLDWEIFCHYVLFPRVNDEDLSFHRRVFYDALWPRIRDLGSDGEAVLEVNCWCREIASYELTDERTASPLTVFRCGSGRCGEESAFLVSALRSVGIPARQVYVPRWSHCDDNHAWVEALCGGVWRFLGACEPEPELNRGWFNTAATRAVLVRSRLFGEGSSPLHGQLLGREGGVAFYNQTARYAPASWRVFRVLTGGEPAPGAQIRLQILNEASFHTVAALTADSRGEAVASLGAGTVHVLARLGELRAEGDCDGVELTLELSRSPKGDTGWEDFDFHASQASPVPPLDIELRKLRARALREGDELRNARNKAILRTDPAHPEWDDLLLAARGNSGELAELLRGGETPDRERLLRTLTAKDLRDTPRRVLEEHLARLPARPEGVPEEIYWQYLASPRIALEKIAPWRTEPDRELKLMDRDAATVAAARLRGVPARLRPLDGAPEVWESGGFRPVFPEKTGILRVKCQASPAYRQRWSLSRLTPEGWRLLDLSGVHWEGGELTVTLPVGRYRVVTANRLPNGNQLASRRDFDVAPGAEREIELRERYCDLGDMLFSQELPAVPGTTPEGEAVADVLRLGSPTVAVWLEDGAEPTEHILNELSERLPALSALPAELVLMIRGPESATLPAVSALLNSPARVRAVVDDWSFDTEDLARRLARDPDTPPLAIVCDGHGRAVYADSGYRAGSADLLTRIAAYLCAKC